MTYRPATTNLAAGEIFKREQTHTLYHPSDRETAIFEDEASASLVARWGVSNRPFSLIIVCPLVSANGIGWERIYDTHNRPPIYARWSTGEQAVYDPLVLMCLPKLETKTGRESYHKRADWFCMELAQNSELEKTWTRMWKP